ncbi:MAG: hypothetical protein NVS3B12_28200 [Acidimicrobiales bacterium]
MTSPIRRLQRGVAVAATTALTAGVALAALPPVQAAHASGFSFTRIAGANRFGTAAALATRAFPGGTPTAIIATGFNFPDALAGNYIAGQDSAPILLVNASGPIPQETLDALKALKTSAVTILGLQSAVGDDVAQQLSSTQSTSAGGGNIKVSRIGGATRYDTAKIVNETPGAAAVGTVNGKKTAFLARGDKFPDALGAGPVAYSQKFPVILTDPNALSPQAAQTLTDLGIQQLLILGGTQAISTSVEQAADANGVTTLQRFAGTNRSDTSRLVADYAIANFKFSNSMFSVASGDANYGGADALASGPFGATQGLLPTLITNSVNDAGEVVTFGREHGATEQSGFAIGGVNPLPDATLNAIVAGVNSSATFAATTLPQLLTASIVGTNTTATSGNPAGTTIRYVFSQDLSKAVIHAAGFLAYDANDGRFIAQSAVISPANTSAVDAFYGQTTPDSGGSGTTPTNLQTTAGAANLTLAAVGGPQDVSTPGTGTPPSGGTTGPAVTTTAGSNPDGSAPIGTPTPGTTPQAGVTAAPDPESFAVGGVANTTTYPNATTVSVTFDKAAFAQIAATSVPTGFPATSSSGFSVVFTTTVTTGGPVPPATSVNEEGCYGPSPSDTTTTSGGTGAGGNGTTTITVVCPNRSTGSTIAPADIARVVIQPGAVGTASSSATGTGNFKNPLQASDSPRNMADSPSLTAVTFTPGSGTAADQIIYTFDRAVTGPTATGFGFYRADGTQVTCVAQTSTSSTGPFCSATVASDPSKVVVTVGTTNGPTVTGSGATTNATGGTVTAGSVTSANAPATKNADDEFGGLGASTASNQVTPGTVNAPQLTSVTLAQTTNQISGTVTTATYNFTQPVSAGAVGGLHLYDADGTELTCSAMTAPAGTGTAQNSVSCNAFTQSGGSAATATQLSGVVIGTADYKVVTGTTANATNPNPEGLASAAH